MGADVGGSFVRALSFAPLESEKKPVPERFDGLRIPTFSDCTPLDNIRQPMGCIVGVLLNTNTGEVIPRGCGRWVCPSCGPRKVRAWVMRVAKQPARWFLTLTLSGDGQPTKDNLARLARGWRAVRQWLKRRYRLTAYTWARECGANATRRLHLHVLLECDRIPVRRLRRVAVGSGLGRWMHLSAVKSERHARHYVAKYVGKAAAVEHWPRYARRAQTTAPRPPREAGWCFLKRPRWTKRRYRDALYLTPEAKNLHAEATGQARQREATASPAENQRFANGPPAQNERGRQMPLFGGQMAEKSEPTVDSFVRSVIPSCA